STGWQYTIAKNSSLGCIENHTDCSSYDEKKTKIFQIQNVADSPYLTNLGADTRGIGLDGNGCDYYNAINGNPKCPIKVDITWMPKCTDSPCIDPAYQVEVIFSYSVSGSKIKLDMSKYNFVLSK
ncbi:MAG: hypothetical protein AAB276_05335, partial [Pseudomonadota bacterium]